MVFVGPLWCFFTGVEVHVIIAACENMISDKAYRPGDILTASNGKVSAQVVACVDY